METPKTGEPSSPKSQKWFLLSQILVRTLGIAATLIATALMATNKQTISFLGVQIDAKYNYSSAFKFYVAANSAASFLSVLSLSVLIHYVAQSQPTHCQKKYYIIFLLDLVVMVCLVSGSSAASAFAYVGKYGNHHAEWMEICGQFGKYCNKTLASLFTSYTATLLFLVLTIWSSWKATTTSNSEAESNKVGNGFVSAI